MIAIHNFEILLNITSNTSDKPIAYHIQVWKTFRLINAISFISRNVEIIYQPIAGAYSIHMHDTTKTPPKRINNCGLRPIVMQDVADIPWYDSISTCTWMLCSAPIVCHSCCTNLSYPYTRQCHEYFACLSFWI